MAGGAVGMGMQALAPFPTTGPGAYALVGMILVPLMLANLLRYMISARFQPKPVDHAFLEQDHVHMPGPATRFAASTYRAGDFMDTDPLFIPGESSAREAATLIAGTRPLSR